MLYNVSQHTFESHKERNLYYKFFAGYFLNPLVDTDGDRCKERLDALAKILQAPVWHTGDVLVPDTLSTANHIHVSFDNHADQIKNLPVDKGEFADILIQGVDSNGRDIFIAIEAKFLSRWKYEKDVIKVNRRIAAIRKALPSARVFRFLLLTEAKWNNVRKKRNQTGSQLALLEEWEGDLSVILWEQFTSACKNPRVNEWLLSQLCLTDNTAKYDVVDGRLFRAPCLTTNPCHGGEPT